MHLAQVASSLLENEVVKRFFDDIERILFEKWLATDPKDGEGREILYYQVDLSRKFKQYFAATIANGKGAADMLEMLIRDDI